MPHDRKKHCSEVSEDSPVSFTFGSLHTGARHSEKARQNVRATSKKAYNTTHATPSEESKPKRKLNPLLAIRNKLAVELYKEAREKHPNKPIKYSDVLASEALRTKYDQYLRKNSVMNK